MSLLEIALIAYENADRTIVRWQRDIEPALRHRAEVTCVDNSARPSVQLERLFGTGYLWAGGANLQYAASLNLIVHRAQADHLLYVCTNHGRMLDRGWIEDLLRALIRNEKVAMAGCLAPSASPERIGATEFLGCKLAPFHIQGGVFAAKVAVMKDHPYPAQFPHLYSDHMVCWSLMKAGWQLAHVPSIKSVWRQKVTDLSGLKFVHDDTE